MSDKPKRKHNLTRSGEFVQGMRDTIPLLIGAAPFGIIFGVIGVAGGLSAGAVMGFSLAVFAGSAQFIAAKLVADGVGIALIVLTTFVVNLRHALYSASLGPHMKHLGQNWILPLAFWLTDETYAIVVTRWQDHADQSPYKHWYHLGSAVVMYVNWQIWTLIGLVAGTQLEGIAGLGLEFAMVVTFIGIVVPLVKTRPMVLCALVAGVVAVLARDLPNNLGLLLAAVVAIAAGYLAETMLTKERTYDAS